MALGYKSLLIRADASTTIGTGHLMRMIALAQEWNGQGGEVTFACSEITESLEQRIAKEGFRLQKIPASPGSREDLEATVRLIASRGTDAALPTILDGYRFDDEFQKGLKKQGCRLLALDDYGHCSFYHADWVLNQNISAREELYRNRTPGTNLLLGTQYALLRREFLDSQGWSRVIPEKADKLLVTLGGSDPDNVTERVMEGLSSLDILIKVVVGGSNPHLESLRRRALGHRGDDASFELIVNPTDMPGLMRWADMAVAAGGSTAWELSFLGVPSVYLTLADNQREVTLALARLGAGLGSEDPAVTFPALARRLAEDRELRERLSHRASELVDGGGVSRVCNHFL